MEEEKKKKGKGGRPPKAQERSHHFGFFATPTEKVLIEAKAKMNGVRPATYLRDLALKGKVRPIASPGEVQLFRDLTGMANNLNQLTKEAHQSHLAVVVPRILRALEEVNNLIKRFDHKNENR